MLQSQCSWSEKRYLGKPISDETWEVSAFVWSKMKEKTYPKNCNIGNECTTTVFSEMEIISKDALPFHSFCRKYITSKL